MPGVYQLKTCDPIKLTINCPIIKNENLNQIFALEDFDALQPAIITKSGAANPPIDDDNIAKGELWAMFSGAIVAAI